MLSTDPIMYNIFNTSRRGGGSTLTKCKGGAEMSVKHDGEGPPQTERT